MNGRTAKLLNKVASEKREKPRDIKREWSDLTAREKAVKRAEFRRLTRKAKP